ncbi:MAG: hypothetical protein ACLFVK_08430 [Dehalococcoidia bacterium]
MKHLQIISFLLVITLVLTSCSCFPNIVKEGPQLIDSTGFWNLGDLGYSDVIFSGTKEEEAHSINYALPEGAAQGPDTWYVLHLNFDIEFSPDTEEGVCYVGAGTNGYACAKIRFEVKKKKDAVTVDWSHTGLRESVSRSTDSLDIHVPFKNYLRTAGVRADSNTLTFTMRKYGNVKVKRLCILKSSGIEYTSVSPPELSTGPVGTVSSWPFTLPVSASIVFGILGSVSIGFGLWQILRGRTANR